jgi:hypothetical protein
MMFLNLLRLIAIRCGVLFSQVLHCSVAGQMGWPLAWDHGPWSAKRARSLLEQLGPGVESDLIEDEDLGRDEPDCETNHQGTNREWCYRLDYFHG